MRELSETFSKKYNFKRLLQTTPNLSKLYNRHEDAVNSITPIKRISLYNSEKLAILDPNTDLFQEKFCNIRIFGPSSKEWPSRIKYAEQILDVYTTGKIAWVVRICGNGQPGGMDIEIIEFRSPAITIHYPDKYDKPANHYPILNQKKLARIDQNPYVSYFLISEHDEYDHPINLRDCGLIPDGLNIYHSAFYDQNIAFLYAESLQKLIISFPGYRF